MQVSHKMTNIKSRRLLGN